MLRLLEQMEKMERNPLGTHEYYGEMFKAHIKRQKNLLKKGNPMGWFWAAFPQELAYVFDVANIFPEQYSAYAAAKQKSVPLINSAQQSGTEKFMCDYLKTSIGSILNTEDAPLGGHVGGKPDFVLDSRMCCFGHHAMSEVYTQLYDGIKRFVLDSPFWTRDLVDEVDQLTKEAEVIDEEALNYVIEQLKDFVSFLEDITGEKLSEDKMKKVFKRSEETANNLIEIDEMMYEKPVPMSQLEYRDFPTPGFYLHGSKYDLEFSRKVKKAAKERVKAGEGVVREEKLRLMTHGIMPWFSRLYKDLEERGVVFPINPYIEGSISKVDPRKPYESMARRSILYTNSAPEVWLNPLLERAKRAEIDGAILFENTGCRPVSLPLRRLKLALSEELGISSLVVAMPQCDPSQQNVGRVRTKIESFVESLLQNKNKD